MKPMMKRIQERKSFYCGEKPRKIDNLCHFKGVRSKIGLDKKKKSSSDVVKVL